MSAIEQRRGGEEGGGEVKKLFFRHNPNSNTRSISLPTPTTVRGYFFLLSKNTLLKKPTQYPAHYPIQLIHSPTGELIRCGEVARNLGGLLPDPDLGGLPPSPVPLRTKEVEVEPTPSTPPELVPEEVRWRRRE